MTRRDRDDVTRHLPMKPRDFEILLALAREPKHGYGIMQELRARWLLGPGTLYRILKEMATAGLVEAGELEEQESDGPPRRYYRLTGLGRRVAAAEANRMAELVARARADRLVSG
jgi:DNA-binding PadR family transcriptional regulator